MREFTRRLARTVVIACLTGLGAVDPGCSSQPNESSDSSARLSVRIEDAATGQLTAIRVRLASRTSDAI